MGTEVIEILFNKDSEPLDSGISNTEGRRGILRVEDLNQALRKEAKKTCKPAPKEKPTDKKDDKDKK